MSKFYYIIDVLPAGTLLSDYQRGSWSVFTLDAPNTEYTKLWTGNSEGLDDVRMLTSATHSSSGSTLRPFINDNGIADRRWLIGSWVPGSACATHTEHEFNADGSYGGYETAGRWTLTGDIVTLQIKEEFELGGEERLILDPPRVVVFRIERADIDRMRVRARTGDVSDLIRC
jgi:hypothetical protein